MDDEYAGPERRQNAANDEAGRRGAVERRSGLDRRRGPGRRRGEVRKAAEEGEITDELYDFIRAIDDYKRINARPFPTYSEIFEIMKFLGYRRVAERAAHINAVENEGSGPSRT